MTLRERIEARLALAESAFWWRAVGSSDPATDAFIADRSPDRVIAECRADLDLMEQMRKWDDGLDVTDVLANLAARYPEDVNA